MLSLFKKQKKSNKFLVLDIDNDQIKVLAIYKDLDNTFKIIGSSIKKLPENTLINYHILDRKTLSSYLSEAISECTLELEDVLKDIIVGFKGTQCIQITTTAKSTSTHKRIIQEEEIEEVYKKILDAAIIQAQNDVVKINGDYDCDLEIIASSNVYFKVDGQFIDDPIKTEGEIFECAIFNAFSVKQDLIDIRKLIKSVNLNLLAVSPIPYNLVQNISNSLIKENTDYTLINFSQDITEVIIVFGKGLIDTKTLPIGYEHLKHGLSNKMGLTLLESEKVLQSYSLGKLQKEEEIVIQKCLDDILHIWVEGIKICFENFSEIKTYASQIYLTGEGSLIPDVINIFNSENWYKEIPFKTAPTCAKLNINDFNLISDATSKVNSPLWISTLSLYIAYLEQEEQND